MIEGKELPKIEQIKSDDATKIQLTYCIFLIVPKDLLHCCYALQPLLK